MTELQMGLIGLGAIAVVGVVAYNKWQEHRHRKLAEKVLARDHEDVLLGRDAEREHAAAGEAIDIRRGTDRSLPLESFIHAQIDRISDPAQLAALEMTGDVICSTGRDLMNPDGTFTGKYIPVKSRLDYHELLKHNSINCSSVLILREVALEFPMEHDDSHEDYITWLKVVRKYGHATGINRPYLKYRLSQGGKSRNKAKSAIMTYQVYRYVGYGPVRSACFFLSYALHGIWKYR